MDVRYWVELADDLRAAKHGELGKILKQAMEFTGMGRNTLYRHLEKHAGYTSGRKQRSDKGNSMLTDQEVKIIAAQLHIARRKTGKRIMTIEDAIEIAYAKENRLISCKPSLSTVIRRMRDLGVHPEQLARPTPHTMLRSLHPNHVWQVDPSICSLWYLDDKRGLEGMDKGKFYKNKPQNFEKISKKRVWRYVVTDHASGAFFFKYYLTPGESQEILFKFLMDAMHQRDHAQDPFHGVPFIMLWDQGSAMTSYAIQNLMSQLDVRTIEHKAGNPRAKGQVERTNNLIETGFEGRLKLEDLENIRTIEQLNAAGHKWMRNYNGLKKHSRHGRTRYGDWQMIRENELRICPSVELCQDGFDSKPKLCTVDGYLRVNFTVKGYGSMRYSVEHIEGVRVGEKINVCANLHKAPSVFVLMPDQETGEEVRIECVPDQLDNRGFDLNAPVIGESYRAVADTDVDTNRKEIVQQAFDAETLEEAEKLSKKNVPAFNGQIDTISYLERQTNNIDYMKRKGTPSAMERPREETPPLNRVQIATDMARRLDRPLTVEENQRLPETCKREELDAVEAMLRGEPQSTFQTLKLVVNG